MDDNTIIRWIIYIEVFAYSIILLYALYYLYTYLEKLGIFALMYLL